MSKVNLPKDYKISAKVEVDGEQYEVSTTVTREFLTDSDAAVPFILGRLDEAASKIKVTEIEV